MLLEDLPPKTLNSLVMPSMLWHSWQSTWERSILSQAETQCRFGLLFQRPRLCFPTLLSELQCPATCVCAVGCEAMECQAPICLLDRKSHPHSATRVQSLLFVRNDFILHWKCCRGEAEALSVLYRHFSHLLHAGRCSWATQGGQDKLRAPRNHNNRGEE